MCEPHAFLAELLTVPTRWADVPSRGNGGARILSGGESESGYVKMAQDLECEAEALERCEALVADTLFETNDEG